MTNVKQRIKHFTTAMDMSIISYDEKHNIFGTSRSEAEVLRIYEAWLVKHGKVQNSLVEKDRRFEIFKDNLRFIDEHNEKNLSYRLGLNRFSDLTNSEYRSMYLRTKMEKKSERRTSQRYQARVGDELPDSVDWRKKGAVADDEDEDEKKKKEKEKPVQSKVYRLFGREKPVHKVLGGGKPADIFMWKNKKISGGVLGGATAAWVLFELMEYHLLTLLCHVMIVVLAVLFLLSNATVFIKKSPPKIPEVHIPEEPILQLASGLRIEINRGFSSLCDIASGRDIKKFLITIAGLWILSILGGCFNFLTLAYIALVLLFTVPLAYDKYEDKVDPLGEKAVIQFKKQYAVLDEKVLRKIPLGPFKNKKKD